MTSGGAVPRTRSFGMTSWIEPSASILRRRSHEPDGHSPPRISTDTTGNANGVAATTEGGAAVGLGVGEDVGVRELHAATAAARSDIAARTQTKGPGAG